MDFNINKTQTQLSTIKIYGRNSIKKNYIEKNTSNQHPVTIIFSMLPTKIATLSQGVFFSFCVMQPRLFNYGTIKIK